MSSASLRRAVRLLHVAAACALGTYLYSPLIDATWAARVLQIGVFPAMAVSGLAMWQQARLRRWLGARG
jgi:high-affinity Fe2+/Pb2+ permease